VKVKSHYMPAPDWPIRGGISSANGSYGALLFDPWVLLGMVRVRTPPAF